MTSNESMETIMMHINGLVAQVNMLCEYLHVTPYVNENGVMRFRSDKSKETK